MYSDLAHNVALLYLMMIKPATLASVLVVVLTNGVFLALATASGRGRPAARAEAAS